MRKILFLLVLLMAWPAHAQQFTRQMLYQQNSQGIVAAPGSTVPPFIYGSVNPNTINGLFTNIIRSMGLLSDANTWTGTNTFSGTNTFTGTTTFPSGTVSFGPGTIPGSSLAPGAAVTNLGYTPMNPANNGSDFANEPLTILNLSAIPHVSNLAALKAYSAATGAAVTRDGYTVANDAGAPVTYFWSASACPLNSGAGDNGWQVQGVAGCWIAALPSSGADPRLWGAKCDGATDDVVALKSWAATIKTNSIAAIYGPCAFSSPIQFPAVSNVTLVGSGANAGLIYIGPSTPAGATLTASISGTTLTVSSGTPTLGAYLVGAGIPANEMIVNGTGPTYTLSLPAGAIGSESMTTTPPIVQIGVTNNCLKGWSIKGLRVRSSTIMSAGDGLQIDCISGLDIADLDVGGPGTSGGDSNWYNGFHLIGSGTSHIRGYGFRGNHYGSIIQGTWDGGAALDVFLVQGAITKSAIGLVIGGGAVPSIDMTDIVNNGANVVIDQEFVPYYNRQVFFGSTAIIDGTDITTFPSATGIGLELADPGNNVGGMSQLSFQGVWSSFAKNQNIKIDSSALNWEIWFKGGEIISNQNASTPSFDNESTSANLHISIAGTRFWNNTGKDIYNIAGANPINVQAAQFDSNKGNTTGAITYSLANPNGDIYELSQGVWQSTAVGVWSGWAGTNAYIHAGAANYAILGAGSTSANCGVWLGNGATLPGAMDGSSAGCINNLGSALYPFNKIYANTLLTAIPHVANLTALTTWPTSASPVLRDGYAAPGDAGIPVTYYWSASACSLNAGAGDGGWQVQPNSGGGCWTAALPTSGADIRIWGATSSSSDNSAAFLAAANAASSGQAGGEVLIPPTYFKVAQSANLDLRFAPNIKVGCVGGTSGLQAISNLTAPCTLQVNPPYSISLGNNQEIYGIRVVNQNVERQATVRAALTMLGLFSGTGILIPKNASDDYLHEVTVNGFTTGLSSSGALRLKIHALFGDDTNVTTIDSCSDACNFDHMEGFNLLTSSPGADATTWAQSTNYAFNSIVLNGVNLYQETGTAPCVSAPPAATGPSGTGTNIADGSCTWAYLGYPFSPTYSITGVSDAGAGLSHAFQITTGAQSTPLVSGDIVDIYGIGVAGQPSGRYTVGTVINSTNFTLASTTYASGYVSGGSVFLPTNRRYGTAFVFSGTAGETVSSLWDYGHDTCVQIATGHGPTNIYFAWCDGPAAGYEDAVPKGIDSEGFGGGLFGGWIGNKAIGIYENSSDTFVRPFTVSGLSFLAVSGCNVAGTPAGSAVTIVNGSVTLDNTALEGPSGCAAGYNAFSVATGKGPLLMSNMTLNGYGVLYATPANCLTGAIDGSSRGCAPASVGTTCTAGQTAYDGTYFYVCTATNTWGRALTTDFSNNASVATLTATKLSFTSLAATSGNPSGLTGFCASPTLTSMNGSVGFTVTTGASSCGSGGTIFFTGNAAAHGWKCNLADLTNPAGNLPAQTSYTTTSAVFTNYNRSGVTTNWTSGDVLLADCHGF